MLEVTRTPKVNLTSEEERLVYAMQLLGDKTRFKIFKLLMNDKELCVTEIASEVGISLSAVSQHFKNFEMLGLVAKKRVGQKICYMLKEEDTLVGELTGIARKERSN